MVMFSELRRFALRDPRGRRGRFLDLTVNLSAGDYPRVTRLLYRTPRGAPAELGWEAVAPDWRLRRLNVSDLEAGRAAPPAALRRSVLLERDILDALVLDVVNRHATRANDLWLVEEERALWLRGADVSPWAVLRRLGRGWLGRGLARERTLLDWKDVEFLRGDPRAALEGGDYHRRVARLPAGEIARLLQDLPYLHAAELLTLIPDELAADTLELMSHERQVQVFEELEDAHAVRLLALMAPDLAADLLGRLGQRAAERCLDLLPGDRRDCILELLRFPEDTAGGMMTNEVVVLPVGLTVGEARWRLRDRLRTPDFVYYVYVVDDELSRQLLGVLTLRDLLVADEGALVERVMRPDGERVDPLAPASEAARRLTQYQLAALPVVTGDGRLLGAITVDAAVARVAPPGWRQQAPRIFS